MTKFFFGNAGETLPQAWADAGAVFVEMTPAPSSGLTAGNTWVLGSPQATQNSSGVWVPNWTQQPIPFAPLQQQKLEQVKTHFASLVAAGYTYNGVLIGIGDTDRPNITGKASLALASITSGSGLTWTATAWQPQGAGAPLTISTAADMLTFANTIAIYYSDLVTQAASLESQIAAATTVAAVQAIDVTAGWPTPHN